MNRHAAWQTKGKKLHGRQTNRYAAWPAEKGGHQQYRHRTWQTKVKKSHGREMSTWPAGGKSKEIAWETNE